MKNNQIFLVSDFYVLLFSYLWIIVNLISLDGFEFIICPFRLFFNIPCFSCGLTRSVLSILHGEFLTAMLYNPLGYIATIYLIVAPIALLAFPFQTFVFHKWIFNFLRRKKYMFLLLIVMLWAYVIYFHNCVI